MQFPSLSDDDSDSDMNFGTLAETTKDETDTNKKPTVYIDTLTSTSYTNYYGIAKETYDKFKADMPTDPSVDVDIVLNTTGGSLFYALLIMKALQEHKGKKTAVIPEMATCAGTLIALVCDEIHMSAHACLGRALNRSADYSYSQRVLPAFENWREKNFLADVLYHMYKDDRDEDVVAIKQILKSKYTEEQMTAIVDQFLSSDKSSLPMFPSDLEHLELNITIDEKLAPEQPKEDRRPSQGAGYMTSIMRLVGLC